MKIFRLIRLSLVAGAVALAVMTWSSPGVAAEDCGGSGQVLCSETEACAWWGFGKICTTTYDYYRPPCKYCHYN